MKEHTLQALLNRKIVAILRIRETGLLPNTVSALIEGGIRCIEITTTVPDAVSEVRRLHSEYGEEIILGAGTVLSWRTVEEFVDAGARFIVSPIVDENIVRHTVDLGAVSIPGCFTPSEIFQGLSWGADIVKLFPAGVLGMKFMRDLSGPFPGVRIMPTGGVTVENAAEWIQAGACAVGLGSDLVPLDLVRDKRFSDITHRTQKLLDRINSLQEVE